jgi:hypothetical protein
VCNTLDKVNDCVALIILRCIDDAFTLEGVDRLDGLGTPETLASGPRHNRAHVAWVRGFDMGFDNFVVCEHGLFSYVALRYCLAWLDYDTLKIHPSTNFFVFVENIFVFVLFLHTPPARPFIARLSVFVSSLG